ncbi:TetR/AcrR family transcriptional regulator [Ancylobacter pratisalsi]|uniref:TetR/AcrR family transcriptional regulator n=1 Tax=Ancylobacter pratisalsi TaxID=1745854 RepID=A0A6P1YKZ8_9HYPH|nr:TetR/AcrR family transcriptional regulator [Ancylobacter pratisalsi]QIB34097.1 TetR/AcrR family transcriptional regulator [Ancylobacter pratisalsi]
MAALETFPSAHPPKAPDSDTSGPADISKAGAHPARPEPRRRVLDAAIACFIRNGFHGTSMQEICKAAEMSPGALYRYFPSKDAMIIAIVEEERAARSSLLACLDSAPSFVAGLTAMGEALFSGAMPMVCVELAPEISAEAARNPALKAKFDEVEAEMNGAIRAALVAAQARGEADPSLDADAALLMINAIGDGLLLRNRLNPDLPLAAMMPAIGAMLARMFAPVPSSSPDLTK